MTGLLFNFIFCKKVTHALNSKKGVKLLNGVHPSGAPPRVPLPSERALVQSSQLLWNSPPTPSTHVCLIVQGLQCCVHFYSFT